MNHKAFFGGEADEFEQDEQKTTITTKTSVLVKSKSTDQIRSTTTTTTIIENGKTKLVCPRDQKKVNVLFRRSKPMLIVLHRQMFTIVPNIRQPTTCEELGETQSYIDDMEYLLAGFQADKLLSSRCLR